MMYFFFGFFFTLDDMNKIGFIQQTESTLVQQTEKITYYTSIFVKKCVIFIEMYYFDIIIIFSF